MPWVPSREICRILSSLPDLGLQEMVIVWSKEQGARSEEQVPEGDGDLVDFLDDEPVVVEDDSLRDLVRLGTLLEVTG